MAPDAPPCASSTCANCATLATQVAALQAENARLRLQLDQLHPATPSTAASSPLPPPPQHPAPLPTSLGITTAFSRAEMQRYSRQMLVKDFGANSQQLLRSARVLIIGAGGLGSPVLLYLAAMGVGHLTVVDDDRVDSSNLHRQVLHDESQLQELKVKSAQRRLQLLNPLVYCEPVAERFTTSNAADLVARHDVVVDASDNVGTRYLANSACFSANKPLVSGSAIGMEGQVTVFTYSSHSTGCYRCLYPCPPRSPPMSCAENGVIGVVPGVIGCLQAMEAVKVITGVGEPLAGVQCLYDAFDGQFRRLKLPNRRPDCPVCGSTTESEGRPVDTQLLYEGGGCGDYEAEAAAAVRRLAGHQHVSIEAFTSTRSSKKENRYILLDVRPKTQFDMVHFSEAVHIPFTHFTTQTPSTTALNQMLQAVQVNTTKTQEEEDAEFRTVYVICRRGIDSVVATEWLLHSGIKCAINVDGGYTAYAARVDPTFPIY